MSMMDVPDVQIERVEKFISILEGGALADALMSLCVAYQTRGTKIEHLKEKLARTLEQRQESP